MSDHTDRLYARYRAAQTLANDLQTNASKTADALFDQWLDACRLETTRIAAPPGADWEDKLLAINTLTPATLALRGKDFHDQTRRWYVKADIAIHNEGFLTSIGTGGASPALAVEELWNRMTEQSPELKVARSDYGTEKVYARWENDHWETYSFEAPAESTDRPEA